MTDERTASLAMRMALMERMKNVAHKTWGGNPVRRVHLVIAIDRLLVRLLETTSWGDWVLKRGYASQLRHPSEARFTDDVDIRIEADINTADAMVKDALALNTDDPFSFELAPLPRELVGPPGGGMRYPVVARLVGQELVRFKVDVSSRDVIVGEFERYPSDPIVMKAWVRPYAVLRREMDLTTATVEDAHAELSRFLAPVFGGDRFVRWEPASELWVPASDS